MADRAWRLAPGSAEIGTLFGRLLMVRGDATAALRPLRRALELRPSPDDAAALTLALWQTGQWSDARDCLCKALRQHAVVADGQLEEACRRILGEDGIEAPGWVGITPDLAIVGELSAACPDVDVQFRTEDDSVWRRVRPRHAHGAIRRFHLPCATDIVPPILKVEVAGLPLLGSAIHYPPEFALDGRASIVDGRISGWVSLGWMAEAINDVVIEDDQGRRLSLPTESDPVNPYRRTFGIELKASGLRGARLWCAARLPDGRMEHFPDAPLLLDAGLSETVTAGKPLGRRSDGRARALPRGGIPPVDIIVPVYRGAEETRQCLEALLAARRENVEIVVIEDASPEPELVAALQALAAEGAIRLLRNPTNRGFPASVNRGLAVHPQRDAVIVNSDAIVHGDWLARLQAAAYSASDIGTVTPLANHGSIVSYPGGDETDFTAEEAARIAGLTATANSGVIAEIPVGVGFCMYVRRDCLDESGGFDEETFGKGYGEETDFCLRASARGWRHVVAADVFVLHMGGRSFGTRRHALLDRGRRIVNMRYPGYDETIEAFIGADSLQPIRRRIDEVRLAQDAGPVALLVTLALPGGVDRFVRQRCAVLARCGLRPVLLRPERPGEARCQLKAGDSEELRDLCYDIPAELPALKDLVRRLNVARVELHHFLDLDPAVIELVRSLDVPYDAYIHDYSWICPRLTLLGGDNRYCGEPPVARCEACIEEHGSSLSEDIGVADLRERSQRWLSEARRVIVPSRDTLRRMRRYFPGVGIRQRPWERPVRVHTSALLPSERIRIAVIGAIGVHKGFEVVRACAEDAAIRGLPLEFVVIGYSADDDELMMTGRVFVIGRYEEDEVGALLRRERPQLALFPSVVPETWCFALTHALRAGVPVVAFDRGAVAERLRDRGAGTLLPAQLSPALLNDYLIQFVESGGMLPPSVDITLAHAPEYEIFSDWKQDMGDGGSIMVKERPSSSSAQSLLAATAEAITLNQGLYLFYVRSAAPVRESAGSENVTLPAVQVGLAPGAAAENVQFIAGPQTRGAWLCEPGNMIVAKISGAPVTLLLTSIRKAGGQPLAIDVERLDGRSMVGEEAPAEQAASPLIPILPRQENAGRAQQSSALPAPSAPPARPTPSTQVRHSDVRCEVVAHVQNEGDLSFVDAQWAGGVGRHLWIENFRIRPLNGIALDDIEYKCLTISGYETPWIGGGEECGTRQMSTPLVAFAVRMRAKGGRAALYDCQYSGAFQSGTIVGPVANGTPCRSSVANDALEGIQVSFIARKPAVNDFSPVPTRKPATGPRFSKLREEGAQMRSEATIPLPDQSRMVTGSSWAPSAASTAGIQNTTTGMALAEGHVGVRSEETEDDALGAGAGPLSRATLMKHVLPFLSR